MTDARFTTEQNALLEQVRELHQSSSRRSLLVLALLAVVGGLVLLTIQVTRQNRQVRNEAAVAMRERRLAEQARDALLVTHQRDVAKVEAAQRALAARDLTRLAQILQVAKVEAVSQAQTLEEPAASTQPDAGATPVEQPPIPAQAIAYPQKVYIQFAGLIERSAIVALNQGLRTAGWKVVGPSGERVGRAAGLNEVRYHDGADRVAAEALAAALTTAKVGSQPVKTKQLGAIYAGTLEVWISRT